LSVSAEELADWRQIALKTESAVANAVIGQNDLIHLLTVALFARGHVLLEGDVGVGKTTVLRALARTTGGAFERVEGTIDLMPNDLIYHTYVDNDGQPRIDPGPLLRYGEQLTTFFFNEINRARPQVQSLLLRAMAERSVSAFNKDYQNKVEKEETFELASAARDRFMFELNMSTPADVTIRRSLILEQRFHNADVLIEQVPEGICPGEQLNRIAEGIQSQVQTTPAIEDYLLTLWQASENPHNFGVTVEGVNMEKLILAGASPRGMSALTKAARVVAWLDERDYVIPEDVHAVLPAALAHRIFFTPVYELRRAEIAASLVSSIMNRVAAP